MDLTSQTKINNFINSGWDFSEDDKLEQLRYQTLNISLVFACLGLLVGLAYNYYLQNFVLVYTEMFTFVFLLYIILRLRNDRSDYARTTSFMSIIIILFFDALILFSNPEDMKFMWILVYTAVFIFYKGSKTGWKWILFLCLTLLLVKAQPFLPIAFDWAQINYSIFIMLVLTSLTSFFQYTIEQNYQTILEHKRALKRFNEQLEDTIALKVHEYREKDEMLFQQSKMAAMGEMIGNIAHQWRQPLNTISVVVGGMKIHRELDTLDDDVFDEKVQTINTTVQFLSQTINDFKDYFSPNKHAENFNIKTSLINDVALIEPSYKALGIGIIFNLNDCYLHSYKNELSQVILNILSNAKDALVDSPLRQRYIFITSTQTLDTLTISIKDNAGGIDKEIIHSIFDPYFTTKHKSQGTGIGLFMTQEIIVKHLKGSIQVKNVEYAYQEKTYQGAQFDISLSLAPINNTSSDGV